MTRLPTDDLDKADNTRSSGESLLLTTFAADYTGVSTSASSRLFERCMAATGAVALASGERHETEDVSHG